MRRTGEAARTGGFDRCRPEVDGRHDERPAAGDERPEARPDPARAGQLQPDGDEWVDGEAVGEGVDLARQRPADRVAPDHMVEVVAGRQGRGQVGEAARPATTSGL